MQPDPTPDLDELERLERAATPGPWDIHLRARSGRVMHVGGHVYAEEGRRLIAGCRGASGYELEEHDANAALIAAARNALPWLLRAARERDELRAERDRAVARATSRKLKNQSHAEWRKLCARVGTARATIKKRERRIIALAALRDELRARAEKAEARAKELEERELLQRTACREQTPEERAALAQKEPR